MNKTFYANLQLHDESMTNWRKAIDLEKEAQERVIQFAQMNAWSLVREAAQDAERARENQTMFLAAMRKYSDNMVKAAEGDDNE